METTDLIDRLNDFHKKLAKSTLEKEEYQPLSKELTEIKQLIRGQTKIKIMKKTEIRLEVFNLSIEDWEIINYLCENGYSVFLTPEELKEKIGISGGSFLSGKLNDDEKDFVNDYYRLQAD